jgi:hypothetical protein
LGGFAIAAYVILTFGFLFWCIHLTLRKA